ncbi:AAA family ATPase [Sphingobium sp. JS3065]|uniref:replicative DNA helicase n=1 Tax=Sphingobium sp. JS3065 TaxID=2970925 RepID=UPI002264ECB2|nr:DnaB-like helicase C-terminal domain-containing protein [Sphingobium sp. JS3065]UZW54947.1 AAA family ATPase [Sphingobium sp. JS3065]
MTPNLPSTADEEAAILAAIMMIEGGYDRVAAKLRPHHFSEPLFGRMFEEMGALADAGEAINVFTMSRAMAGEPSFEDLGGHRYWIQLANQPYVMAALGFADDLISQSRRRLLLQSLQAASSSASDLSVDLNDTMEMVEQGLADAMPAEFGRRTRRLGDAYGDAIERIEAIRRGDVDPGLKVYGWSDWNDLTGGMRPGDYVLIGGRPSMGKTALSLGLARRAAQAGKGVLYISREMETPALMERMVADLLFEQGGRAGMSDVKAGNVDDADLQRLWRAKREVDGWPLVIDDPEHLGLGQIGPLIRRHRQAFQRRGEELAMVIIDYLGLIDPPQKGNREQEVSAISRTIKSIAKAQGIPIVVLSQLSRAVEQREDKRPQLSDLRDSGSLEQDADIIVFVYRDEYYLQRAEPDPSDAQKRSQWELDMQAARDRVEIYTAKNRNGELTRRKGYFFGARQAIRNSDFYRSGHDG